MVGMLLLALIAVTNIIDILTMEEYPIGVGEVQMGIFNHRTKLNLGDLLTAQLLQLILRAIQTLHIHGHFKLMETLHRNLYQISDQQFEIIREERPLVKGGEDLYHQTDHYKGFITNISYLKNPVGWLVYIERWEM